MKFKTNKPHYHHLKNKWTAKHKSLQQNIWDKHGDVLRRQIALGAAGSLMLLTAPTLPLLPEPHLLAVGQDIGVGIDNSSLLAKDLDGVVPTEVRSLSTEEETKIAEILSKDFGFKVAAEMEGKRLNRSFGIMGGEQHLYRYPGDNLQKHADSTVDWAMYGGAGIAPGLGAWGYFAPSAAEFDETAKMREKYYLAVQTFLAPGFAENVSEYRDFFKFRKMLVVNPKTGQSVVAVIGDAGPAAYTGKHLGGSPEVMHHLGIAGGPRKGEVLYFFIDDPENKVPLGPVDAKFVEEIARS
jgi:hypothetical protein